MPDESVDLDAICVALPADHSGCIQRSDLLAVRAERDEARAAVRRVSDAIKRGAITAGEIALALMTKGDGVGPSMLDERDELRAEVASQAAEIEQLRADLERANFAREKLAQTIAACPEGHHDANLAHARAERDRLRAEVAQYEGGTWVTEYGAINDNTGEFVPFSWACTNHPDAARAVAETVGKEAMQQRVWRGKPEPIPATEATDGD